MDLFLMDSTAQFNRSLLARFYNSVFSAWTLLGEERWQMTATRHSSLAAAGACSLWGSSGLTRLVRPFSVLLIPGSWSHHSGPGGGAGWASVAVLCSSGLQGGTGVFQSGQRAPGPKEKEAEWPWASAGLWKETVPDGGENNQQS